MAVPWLLIQKPNGNAVLGYSNAGVTFLVLLLLPYLGKIVDRYPRKRVVLVYLGSAIILDALVMLRRSSWGDRIEPEIWELFSPCSVLVPWEQVSITRHSLRLAKK